MNGDPDIIIMGSENGLGKTSILEACTILTAYALNYNLDDDSNTMRAVNVYSDLLNVLFIHAGADEFILEGTFEINGKFENIKLSYHKVSKSDKTGSIRQYFRNLEISSECDAILKSISYHNFEPIILPCLMYFNSYRKSQEGNLQIGMMVDKKKYQNGTPVSTFKYEILSALMGKANLLENVEEHEADKVITTLNDLLINYAGVKISKMRPSKDNSIDIIVTSINTNNSFSFDGLSSGQKEIISTLFLIWKNTKDSPSIILIDEPELHLNAQWHKSFINTAIKLAPQNQYIISTHSKHIFGSVDKERRVLLER
jgi:predicted ATP-binding protein involved in virulence